MIEGEKGPNGPFFAATINVTSRCTFAFTRPRLLGWTPTAPQCSRTRPFRLKFHVAGGSRTWRRNVPLQRVRSRAAACNMPSRYEGGRGNHAAGGRQDIWGRGTPDSCNSCGELNAPLERITSALARAVSRCAVFAVLDADRAASFEQDARRQRVRHHGEISPRTRGLEIAACRRPAAAFARGELEITGAFLRSRR